MLIIFFFESSGGSQRKGTRRRVYRPKSVTKRKASSFVGDGQKLQVDGPSSFRYVLILNNHSRY
jgi:hypothetical protein